jgi:hypothetical protein
MYYPTVIVVWGRGTTVSVVVLEKEQLLPLVYWYVRTWFPGPAAEGWKIFPETPSPNQVPPTGEPINMILLPLTHAGP